MGISVQTLIGLSMISHWPPGSDLDRICLDGSLTYDKPVKKTGPLLILTCYKYIDLFSVNPFTAVHLVKLKEFDPLYLSL